MPVKKKILFIVLCCWTHFIYASQPEPTYGLLFTSSAERIDQRTTLTLFGEKLQKFEDSFTISFDLSIWDIRQFGYIFRIINNENKELDFVFVNFRGENDLYLDFHSPITHNSVSIPIKKEDIFKKRWLKLNFDFDLQSDKVVINLDDSTYTCSTLGLKNPCYVKFAFGLYGLNLDVPRMVVRNIQIKKQGKPSYIFPLNESEGEVVHDNKNHPYGDVKNPDWMINRHFYWEKKITFQSGPTAGVAYDNIRNRILVINKDSISTYSPSYNYKEIIRIPSLPFTVSSGEALYNPKEDKCYMYDLGKEDSIRNPSMAVIDMKDYSVQQQHPALDNTLFHHNVFWNKDFDHLHIFGGYGKYSYSNKLYRYTRETDSWDNLPLSGDQAMPRFFSASGTNPIDSEILIFGGFGNESGRQEHGGRNLYDLHSINLDSLTIKKKWEIENTSATFVPCSNLILDKDHTYFYTLCYPHHKSQTVLQLYRFSLSNGLYEVVSDSIFLAPEKMNTSVYLFYNEPTQEFYAVIRESLDDHTAEVRMYSLISPPVTRAALVPVAPFSLFRSGWVTFTAGVILIIGLIILLIKKTNLFKRKNNDRVVVFQKTKETLPEKRTGSAVYLLGEFTILDKKGTDITYRFSQKLKSLFALILFKSKDQAGISTETLTSELWPDKDTNSAKNIRGVTINRLRNILTEMEGIALIHQNSRWFFSFEDSFYCDYIESLRLMQYLSNLHQEEVPENEIKKLIHILKRGPLFPNMQESWLDEFKREYENLTEQSIKKYILLLNKNKKYTLITDLSEAYFNIDPMDEDVLELCLKAYLKKGKTEQAHILYNKFAVNYKNYMGEEFKRKFTFLTKN